MSTERQGRTAQRSRTKKHLLQAAVAAIRAGERPTVSSIAESTGISRRTAYRYFPSQDRLLSEAALESTRDAIEGATHHAGEDVFERVEAMVRAMLREALANEFAMRTMLALSLEAPSRPVRGVRRLTFITTALEPVRGRLNTSAYARLVNALAMTVGFEALLVLRDIAGLGAKLTVETCVWACKALVTVALAEAEDPSAYSGSGRPRVSGKKGAARRPTR